MNTGIQDAVNLGWKLAFAAANSPDRATTDPLLDSYQRERRPVAQHVMALTHALFWAEAATDPIARFARGPLAPLGCACRAVRARPPPPRRRGCAPACTAPGPLPPQRALRGGPAAAHEASRALATGWRTRPSPSPVLAGSSTNSPRTPASTCCSTATHAPLDEHGSGRTCGSIGSRTEQGAGLIIVRPDGYVGYRTAVVDADGIARWLSLICAAPHVQTICRQP